MKKLLAAGAPLEAAVTEHDFEGFTRARCSRSAAPSPPPQPAALGPLANVAACRSADMGGVERPPRGAADPHRCRSQRGRRGRTLPTPTHRFTRSTAVNAACLALRGLTNGAWSGAGHRGHGAELLHREPEGDRDAPRQRRHRRPDGRTRAVRLRSLPLFSPSSASPAAGCGLSSRRRLFS